VQLLLQFLSSIAQNVKV